MTKAKTITGRIGEREVYGEEMNVVHMSVATCDGPHDRKLLLCVKHMNQKIDSGVQVTPMNAKGRNKVPCTICHPVSEQAQIKRERENEIAVACIAFADWWMQNPQYSFLKAAKMFEAKKS